MDVLFFGREILLQNNHWKQIALSLACLEIRWEMNRRLDRESSSFFLQSQALQANK